MVSRGGKEMVKQGVDERRRAIRAKRVLSIQHRSVKGTARAGKGSWHLSTTYDMSISGLAFLSDVPYRANDILEIHVVMSGILDIFKGLAQVVRVQKRETGVFYFVAIKFIESKPPARRKAKSYTRPQSRTKAKTGTSRLKKAPKRK